MNVGIVGNGMIVHMFLKDIQSIPKFDITAICVRNQSEDKGKEIANIYHIPHLYTDYERFLNDKNIDTVYIGISNHMHYGYAKNALKHGKNVILEKPFTVNAKQARSLVNLAKKNHLFLWEACVVPYTQLYPIIYEQLKNIAPIKLVRCDYCKLSSRYADYKKRIISPAFDPDAYGGGSIRLKYLQYSFHRRSVR